MLRSIGFFSNYIITRKNMPKILIATLIDLITSIIAILPTFLVFNYFNANKGNKSHSVDDIDSSILILLGSALILLKLLPKVRNTLLFPIAANVQKELTLDLVDKCFELEFDQYINTPVGDFSKSLKQGGNHYFKN